MSEYLTLPMPGEFYDGKTVIASCWVSDDAIGPSGENLTLAGLLLLDPSPNRSEPDPAKRTNSFYSVVQIVAQESEAEWSETIVQREGAEIRNIVEAAEAYREETGCI